MVKQVAYTVLWDVNALEQFKEILAYLSEQSGQAAKIVKDSILERIERIRHNPFIFEFDKLKSLPNEEFRAFVVFSYRVTYQVKEQKKEIRILRVRHTSREPQGY